MLVETPDGDETQLYRDENPKPIATKRISKKLQELLVPILRDARVTVNRYNGVVLRNGVPLAKVDPQQDLTFDLFWNAAELANTNLDKSVVAVALQAATSRVAAPDATTQWTL